MKHLRALPFVFALVLAIVFGSCGIGFESPGVTVNSISGTIYTSSPYHAEFDVECDVQNMDSRAATVTSIEYTVTLEGLVSDGDNYNLDSGNQAFTAYGSLGSLQTLADMPVTYSSLTLLGASTTLAASIPGGWSYTVTGTFTADTPIGELDLPFSNSGNLSASALEGIGIDNGILLSD